MTDVVIIGGGHAGRIVGRGCAEAKLEVVMIDECLDRPADLAVDWVCGRGTVAGAGLVAVLDPVSGDERRIIPARAIVIAIGQIDPAKPLNRMLGITKLGAAFTPDNQYIVTDHRGQTGANGIFAVGSCASTATPHIIDEIIEFCASKLTK